MLQKVSVESYHQHPQSIIRASVGIGREAAVNHEICRGQCESDSEAANLVLEETRNATLIVVEQVLGCIYGAIRDRLAHLLAVSNSGTKAEIQDEIDRLVGDFHEQYQGQLAQYQWKPEETSDEEDDSEEAEGDQEEEAGGEEEADGGEQEQEPAAAE